MPDYCEMWYTKDGLRRIRVYPTEQKRTKKLGPITVWKDQWGVTYSSKYIREWAGLSADQKSKAYRDAYQASREDSLWRIAKDPALESQWEIWKETAKQERDKALSAIANGEEVPPPKHVWE